MTKFTLNASGTGDNLMIISPCPECHQLPTGIENEVQYQDIWSDGLIPDYRVASGSLYTYHPCGHSMYSTTSGLRVYAYNRTEEGKAKYNAQLNSFVTEARRAEYEARDNGHLRIRSDGHSGGIPF